jgi:hypothetical protein
MKNDFILLCITLNIKPKLTQMLKKIPPPRECDGDREIDIA